MDRNSLINLLRGTHFDLIVVGGGATGSGVALEAACRGCKVALLERDDFSSETSSRSTKLIHGGVRYLEQAVKNLQYDQYHLVKDALRERKTLLRIAPHLCKTLPILTPIYSYWEIPYYNLGLKLYDYLSQDKSLGESKWIDRDQTLEYFPYLVLKDLKGAVLYFDGQFDDARMNLSLVQTAAEQGALVLNYGEVESLIREQGQVCGVEIKDRLSGVKFSIRSTAVVNACGPFVDHLRKMDDRSKAPLISPSNGTHIVLSKNLCERGYGVLIPKTKDDRVVFVLPWQGHTLVGTTDTPCKATFNARPSKEDISYLLSLVETYFGLKISEQDVISSWSGIRPLVSDSANASTSKLTRDHHIEVSRSGLVTITGGKWTTYRLMAKDVIDRVDATFKLGLKEASGTDELRLVGGVHFDSENVEKLQRTFGLEKDITWHLHRTYGDRAERVAHLAKEGYARRLLPTYPYIEAEVIYGVRYEFALTAMDILARRLRLSFLNVQGVIESLSRVIELMAMELAWSPEQCKSSFDETLKYFGLGKPKTFESVKDGIAFR